jgi:hypothetical protein
MAELLFIQPEEITSTTVLGGNVDIDKYVFCIANVQLTVIEPLLGSILYDKIIADIEADTLSGKYLELFNNFVKPITKNSAIAEFITIASYMLTNGGLYKHSPENSEVVDQREAQFLAKKYSDFSQMYITRFNKWICKNPLTEYKRSQDEVNAIRDLQVTAGWKLDNNITRIKWYLQE